MKQLYTLLFASLLGGAPAFATTYTFTGTGNWSDMNLWDVYPGSNIPDGDLIVISAGSACTAEDMPADDYYCEGNIRVEGQLTMEDYFTFDSLQVIGSVDISTNLGVCNVMWLLVEGGTATSHSPFMCNGLLLSLGGVVNLYESGGYTFDFIDFMDNSALNIHTDDMVTIGSNIYLNAGNSIYVDSNATFLLGGQQQCEGTLVNDGNISGMPGFMMGQTGRVVNNGYMLEVGFDGDSQDSIINNGIMDFNNDGGTGTTTTTIVNNGIMMNGYFAFGDCTFYNAGQILASWFMFDESVLENTGYIEVLSMTVFHNSTLDNKMGAELIILPGQVLSIDEVSILINQGYLMNQGSFYAEEQGTFHNTSTGLALNQSVFNNLGSFVNDNLFINDSTGTFNNLDMAVNNDTLLNFGILINQDTLNSLSGAFINVGQIFGNGYFAGGILNGGVIGPGDSPGLIGMDGMYGQDPNGIYECELGGAQLPGVDYDNINVSGMAMLGGTLDVRLINGFVPVVGDQFEVLTAIILMDTFATLLLPALPAGRVWSVEYTPFSVLLEVQQAVGAEGLHAQHALGVSPNPTSGALLLGQPFSGLLTVYAANGQAFRHQILRNALSLDLADLPSGTYNLRFAPERETEEVTIVKVVKE